MSNNLKVAVMKAIEILKWICEDSINGEFLNTIEVPEAGVEEDKQNRQWWITQFGFAPYQILEPGTYLYFYASQIDVTDHYIEPDAHIVIENEDNMWGYDYVNLYRIGD